MSNQKAIEIKTTWTSIQTEVKQGCLYLIAWECPFCKRDNPGDIGHREHVVCAGCGAMVYRAGNCVEATLT